MECQLVKFLLLLEHDCTKLQKQNDCFNHRVRGYHGCRQAEESVVMREVRDLAQITLQDLQPQSHRS